MKNVIKIESLNINFAKTNGILLEETPKTALAFFPDIHPGGVRGHLIRYAKNKDYKWERMQEEDFRKLKLFEGVHIALRTDQLDKLCTEVSKRKSIISQEGVQSGRTEYIVTEKNDSIVIDNENIKNILEQILKQNYSEDFWNLLNSADPALADKLSAGHLQIQRKKIISELKDRLNQNHHETKGDNAWQRWIYKHNWLFGVNYKIPIEKQKINLLGIMPDYLFPTVDNFIDILEIKLPSFEVIEEDKNHKGSWIWSKESNQAIGQVVTYLNEIDRLRLEIEKLIKQNYDQDILMLKPRAYILIGQSESWNNEKKEGLRKLNHALHGIEIITYSDLVKRGETFIKDSIDHL